MKRVIIESPYAGDMAANGRYALRCVADSLARGEAPFASHLFYPHLLEDSDADQRALGIAAGHAWTKAADLVAVYIDYGISEGMWLGIKEAEKFGVPLEYRNLLRGNPA